MGNAPLRIMLTGGGSGGHFYPLISIAETLRELEAPVDLYYAGPDPYDARALEAHGIFFVPIGAGKRRRYSSVHNVLDIFKTVGGFFTALYHLFRIYPDVVISKGSHTSVPVTVAAFLLMIPVIVHESDTKPGRANALASRFAKVVAISFPEAEQYFVGRNVVMTGIPMRRSLCEILPDGGEEALGLDPSLLTLFVIGGSQGALRINELILESLNELLPYFNIIHQTGRAHFDTTVLSSRELIQDDELLKRYHPVPFFDDPHVLNMAYSVATLVISRAGAGSIHEIAIHGKPSILIPIPEDVSHDQRTNAYAYAGTGAAIVLEESNLTDSLLSAEIDRMMEHPELLSDMGMKALNFAPRNAAETIASLALEITESHIA